LDSSLKQMVRNRKESSTAPNESRHQHFPRDEDSFLKDVENNDLEHSTVIDTDCVTAVMGHEGREVTLCSELFLLPEDPVSVAALSVPVKAGGMEQWRSREEVVGREGVPIRLDSACLSRAVFMVGGEKVDCQATPRPEKARADTNHAADEKVISERGEMEIPAEVNEVESKVTNKPRKMSGENKFNAIMRCMKRKPGQTATVPVQTRGWKEGDEVMALWEDEQIWRSGVLHEIFGNSALVVCSSEPLVRAAVVPLDQLRRPQVFLPELNTGLEEEEEWLELLTSLLSVNALCCPSSAPLLQLLLPHLSQSQVTPLLHLARLHLPTLALHSPDTLLVLASSLTEELETVFPSLLPSLLLSDSGSLLIASLLPQFDQSSLLDTVAALLQLPRLPALLPRLLLDMTTPSTAAFCLLTEAILADLSLVLEQEEGLQLVRGLLSREQHEVTARVAALMTHISGPGTQEVCRALMTDLQFLQTPHRSTHSQLGPGSL
jgi:hypothetical protein